MGILINRAGVGHVDSSDDELDRQLREGDGLAWPGDPSLELRYGVIVAKQRQQAPNGRWYNPGAVMARRYEVWRHCEDGQERRIAHWRMEERDRIIWDLARMRAEAPGHEDINDVLDRGNAAVEQANADAFRDSYGEMLDHAMRLAHDTTQPGHTFRGMPGFRDKRAAASDVGESGQ